MDALTLSKTEVDYLQRLLLELQRDLVRQAARGGHPGSDGEQHVAALELALALLRWDGTVPPHLDAQFGLGAAVQVKLGADAMCAYRHWRSERRKAQQASVPAGR